MSDRQQEYTIKQLGEIAGVSVRTLRYYDEIGLLRPMKINESGYRIYGQQEVNLLQQILFYKAMDFRLEEIQHIINDENFDVNIALTEQLARLINKKKQIDALIEMVNKTIAHNKGEIKMSDIEKFEAFKKDKLQENEIKYGKEIRERYGESVVSSTNERFMDLTEEAFNSMQSAEDKMIEALKEVIQTGDLESKAAQTVYEKHKEWLSFTWPKYSKEAHIGLAEMYVLDERFGQYYKNKVGVECTKLLCEVIKKYAI